MKKTSFAKWCLFLVNVAIFAVFTWVGISYLVTEHLSFINPFISVKRILVFFLLLLFFSFFLYFYIWGIPKRYLLLNGVLKKWNCLSERVHGLIYLMLITCGTLFIVFFTMIFHGNVYAYFDIGSDTYEQYLPTYYLLINKIKSGTLSSWIPEIGYGFNLGYFSLTNPLYLLSVLGTVILGLSSLPYMVILYRIVGILLCAFVAFRFLELFTKNYTAVFIGAYLYAFNGFSMIWGQHYVFIVYSFIIRQKLDNKNRWRIDRNP